MLAGAACGPGRIEGHVSLRLVGLDHQQTERLTIRLSSRGAQATNTVGLAELEQDTILFNGLRAGPYTAEATSRDGGGATIQVGHAPAFEIAEDRGVEAVIVLVDVRSQACAPGELTCEHHKGWDVIIECSATQRLEAIETCPADNHCSDGLCVAEPPEIDPDAPVELLLAICDPAAGPFSATIDNPYLPFPVGQQLVLQGDDSGDLAVLEISPLDETELVAGVETRVVQEREFNDGVLVEVARRYYAQAPDGTVCYYGVDIDIYEDDLIIGHIGTWRASQDGHLPGIMMPANPRVGMRYSQEVAPRIAMDRGEIIEMGRPVPTGVGTFDDTLDVRESSPLDTGASLKSYALGIGLIVDEDLELIE